MSIALARRYRPRRFADLLVQDHVAAALRGAVARNRVGHGYLLTGPRGTGKTTAARILAMALNCERRDPVAPTGEPCGECDSCLRIWNGQANLDVIEIDAASNRGVDDARDLRERAMYAASQPGHHKVYIVDEAHMLTREAWNALLKILEEPPPGVVFVFATTEPQKIANTAAPVMSRLQRFDFRRIGPAAIHARLRDVVITEGVAADDDALLLIARHADGGMRDALSVLDQCLSFGEGALSAERVREVLGLVDDESFAAILTMVAERRAGDVFELVSRLTDAGADLVEVSGGLAEVLRGILQLQLGSAPDGLPESTLRIIQDAAGKLAPEDVLRMLKLLGESETSLRRSANPKLVLETLLLRWALMDRAADLRALLQGGAPAMAAPVPSTTPPATAQTKAAKAPPEASAAPPEPTPAQSPGTHSASPLYPVPWTPEGIRSVWPEIVATASRQSRLLGQSLDQATPVPGEAGQVRLTFGPQAAVFQEGIERQMATVETILGARLGRPVRIIIGGAGSGGRATEPQRGNRMTVNDIRAMRLADLRRVDPVLDAAADALDLEVLDDG
jgi:DNA polymerase-3 subunit gamma/tau